MCLFAGRIDALSNRGSRQIKSAACRVSTSVDLRCFRPEGLLETVMYSRMSAECVAALKNKSSRFSQLFQLNKLVRLVGLRNISGAAHHDRDFHLAGEAPSFGTI